MQVGFTNFSSGHYLGFRTDLHPPEMFETLRYAPPFPVRTAYLPATSKLRPTPNIPNCQKNSLKLGFTHRKDGLGRSNQFKVPPSKSSYSLRHFCVRDRTTSLRPRSLPGRRSMTSKITYSNLIAQFRPRAG